MAAPLLGFNVAPGNQTGTKENNNKRLFRGKLQTLVRSFFFTVVLVTWSAAATAKREEKGNFMYEAGSEQINCNGAVIALPSLEVVKAGKCR